VSVLYDALFWTVVAILSAMTLRALLDRRVESLASKAARSRAWEDAVSPIVKKCQLASSLHMDTRFNSEGSKALGELLNNMAKKLDAAGVDRD
jgi:hypothetical protein